MNCGQVILLNYPFTDFSTTKVRPALVVSASNLNQDEDVVVVPISSRIDENDRHLFAIREGNQYFPQTQLKVSSSVKWTKPTTISKSIVHRRLGSVHKALLNEILSRIKSVFES